MCDNFKKQTAENIKISFAQIFASKQCFIRDFSSHKRAAMAGKKKWHGGVNSEKGKKQLYYNIKNSIVSEGFIIIVTKWSGVAQGWLPSASTLFGFRAAGWPPDRWLDPPPPLSVKHAPSLQGTHPRKKCNF